MVESLALGGAVLDDTPISDGIRYALNQRVGLSRFLDDGRLPMPPWQAVQLKGIHRESSRW